MQLFEDTERTDHGIAAFRESTFDFLNRSARPAAARVRESLNAWYDAYPEGSREGLRSRLADDFYPAWCELATFILLRRSGWSVDVEPVSSNGLTPDFKVSFPGGAYQFVEVTTFSETSDEDRSAEAALSDLYDAANNANTPGFVVSLSNPRNPRRRSPSAKKFARFLELAALEIDHGTGRGNAGSSQARATYERKYQEGSFEITASLFPIEDDRSWEGHRVVSFPGQTRAGTSVRTIGRTIAQKARRYQSLPKPLTVFVFDNSPWLPGEDSFLEALFGKAREDGFRAGVWHGPQGPTYRGVSAVVFGRVFPWNLGSAEVLAVQNPWGESDRVVSGLGLPVLRRIQDRSQREDGSTLGELLGLAEDWPGKLFD